MQRPQPVKRLWRAPVEYNGHSLTVEEVNTVSEAQRAHANERTLLLVKVVHSLNTVGCGPPGPFLGRIPYGVETVGSRTLTSTTDRECGIGETPVQHGSDVTGCLAARASSSPCVTPQVISWRFLCAADYLAVCSHSPGGSRNVNVTFWSIPWRATAISPAWARTICSTLAKPMPRSSAARPVGRTWSARWPHGSTADNTLPCEPVGRHSGAVSQLELLCAQGWPRRLVCGCQILLRFR